MELNDLLTNHWWAWWVAISFAIGIHATWSIARPSIDKAQSIAISKGRKDGNIVYINENHLYLFGRYKVAVFYIMHLGLTTILAPLTALLLSGNREEVIKIYTNALTADKEEDDD